MIKNGCFFCLTFLFFTLQGCYIHQAFYVSPFNGDTPGYNSIPLMSDSLKSAFYVNGAYYLGQANDQGRDGVTAFHTEITRAQNFGFLQASYGLNLSLGTYSVNKWDSSYYNYLGSATGPYASLANPLNAQLINQNSGNKFFGGTGFNGQINGVIPINRGERSGEWRFLGIETSLQHEFGDYLQFRKQLPDSAATLIARSNLFGTLGLYTELVGKTRQGNFGFRFAAGWVLGSAYNGLNIYDNSSGHYLRYNYTAFTFHYTWMKYTGYVQTNSATKAFGVHVGMNYRLGK